MIAAVSMQAITLIISEIDKKIGLGPGAAVLRAMDMV